jgi:hypothetical protein
MAKKPTDPKQDLYIALHQEKTHNFGDSYFHLRARICTQVFEQHAWQPYGCDDTYSDGPYYSNLRISCQGDDKSRTRDREAVYGFSCEYHDIYTVDLRKAERMVKTLRAINGKLEKMNESRGYVTSFGEYVGRLAEAVGAKGIGIKREQPSQYNQATHDWLTVGDGINRINSMIWRWTEDGKPQASSDALSA